MLFTFSENFFCQEHVSSATVTGIHVLHLCRLGSASCCSFVLSSDEQQARKTPIVASHVDASRAFEFTKTVLTILHLVAVCFANGLAPCCVCIILALVRQQCVLETFCDRGWGARQAICVCNLMSLILVQENDTRRESLC